jgi:5-methyltetrahydrofolate--homocysteine methyltransferase
MSEYAILARDSGAKIIGGCCGTTPDHLKAMKFALETRPTSEKPSLTKIVTELGEFSSSSDGIDDTVTSSRRRGRRRLKT